MGLPCLQQWAMQEPAHADGIRLKIKDQRREKSHLFHSLCNAKALGESACSISGLRKRSWMWYVAGTDGSSWYTASKIENTLHGCCCYHRGPGFARWWVSLGVSESIFFFAAGVPQQHTHMGSERMDYNYSESYNGNNKEIHNSFLIWLNNYSLNPTVGVLSFNLQREDFTDPHFGKDIQRPVEGFRPRCWD